MDLDQWEKLSIITWTRILGESIEAKDAGREQYARWMLKDVLGTEVI
ncbi:MAG: hypothetical protein WC554_08580 [Clostridia bacterium]